MAKQVSRDAANAFLAGQEFSRGNTAVSKSGETLRLQLHGNTIAETTDGGKTLRVTLAGWPTVTTRERLNALLAVWLDSPGLARVYQERHVQHLACGAGDFPIGHRDYWTLDRQGRLNVGGAWRP